MGGDSHLAFGKFSALADGGLHSTMGQLSTGQERLFYSFKLEDHIPTNHLLRIIDQCLDFSDVHYYLADLHCPRMGVNRLIPNAPPHV